MFFFHFFVYTAFYSIIYAISTLSTLYYRGHDGQLYGPFSEQDLYRWYCEGYFDTNLLITKAPNESQSWITLGNYFKLVRNHNDDLGCHNDLPYQYSDSQERQAIEVETASTQESKSNSFSGVKKIFKKIKKINLNSLTEKSKQLFSQVRKRSEETKPKDDSDFDVYEYPIHSSDHQTQPDSEHDFHSFKEDSCYDLRRNITNDSNYDRDVHQIPALNGYHDHYDTSDLTDNEKTELKSTSATHYCKNTVESEDKGDHEVVSDEFSKVEKDQYAGLFIDSGHENHQRPSPFGDRREGTRSPIASLNHLQQPNDNANTKRSGMNPTPESYYVNHKMESAISYNTMESSNTGLWGDNNDFGEKSKLLKIFKGFFQLFALFFSLLFGLFCTSKPSYDSIQFDYENMKSSKIPETVVGSNFDSSVHKPKILSKVFNFFRILPIIVFFNILRFITLLQFAGLQLFVVAIFDVSVDFLCPLLGLGLSILSDEKILLELEKQLSGIFGIGVLAHKASSASDIGPIDQDLSAGRDAESLPRSILNPSPNTLTDITDEQSKPNIISDLEPMTNPVPQPNIINDHDAYSNIPEVDDVPLKTFDVDQLQHHSIINQDTRTVGLVSLSQSRNHFTNFIRTKFELFYQNAMEFQNSLILQIKRHPLLTVLMMTMVLGLLIKHIIIPSITRNVSLSLERNKLNNQLELHDDTLQGDFNTSAHDNPWFNTTDNLPAKVHVTSVLTTSNIVKRAVTSLCLGCFVRSAYVKFKSFGPPKAYRAVGGLPLSAPFFSVSVLSALELGLAVLASRHRKSIFAEEKKYKEMDKDTSLNELLFHVEYLKTMTKSPAMMREVSRFTSVESIKALLGFEESILRFKNTVLQKNVLNRRMKIYDKVTKFQIVFTYIRHILETVSISAMAILSAAPLLSHGLTTMGHEFVAAESEFSIRGFLVSESIKYYQLIFNIFSKILPSVITGLLYLISLLPIKYFDSLYQNWKGSLVQLRELKAIMFDFMNHNANFQQFIMIFLSVLPILLWFSVVASLQRYHSKYDDIAAAYDNNVYSNNCLQLFVSEVCDMSSGPSLSDNDNRSHISKDANKHEGIVLKNALISSDRVPINISDMTLKPGHVNVIFSEDYFTVKTVIETIALYRVPDWGSTTRKAAEITAGEVHIQGVPLHEWSKASLYDRTIIFSDSHIRWSLPAGAGFILDSLPRGSETILNPFPSESALTPMKPSNLVKLSSDQWESISLCRTLCQMPLADFIFILLPTRMTGEAAVKNLIAFLRAHLRHDQVLVLASIDRNVLDQADHCIIFQDHKVSQEGPKEEIKYEGQSFMASTFNHPFKGSEQGSGLRLSSSLEPFSNLQSKPHFKAQC